MHGPVRRIEAAVEPDVQRDPGGVHRLERSVDLGEVEGDRFLAEDRHAGLRGGADQLDVRVGRRADRDRIDAGCERVGRRSEHGDAELSPDRVGQRRDDVVHAGELHAVDAAGEQFGVHPADAAASEHHDPHQIPDSIVRSHTRAATPFFTWHARSHWPLVDLGLARAPRGRRGSPAAR